MNFKKFIPWIIIGLIVIWAISKYNGIVGKDQTVKKTWGNVESDYQRRMDLIPNLVNTVKGYANFEKETLTKVIEARASATQVKIDPTNLTPEKLAEFQQAQGGLSQALGRLMVVAEKYPDLKANQNFLDLQAQLEGTENRINVSRQRFNDAVSDYNIAIVGFPGNLVAMIGGFKEKGFFQAAAGADKAPEVKF
ncbi:MAG: LemA family protein [Bacteroidetes bacterium]|nr:LemA family protein [Bacteroidota bacterium]MBS1539458.1 LemA family protein [Bacteroidota bacterium]